MSDNLANLKWQRDMGADESLCEKPINHMVEATEKQEISTPVKEFAEDKIMANKAPQTQLNLEKKARKLADEATNLEELRANIESFNGLSIKKTATNLVFSDGNPAAKVMIIGEAPGADEDREGVPFCGTSGKFIDIAFKQIGLTREKNLYITNTVFWRPPGNRKPTDEELNICKPFLEKHIALVNPEILILVGGTSSTSLLNEKKTISVLRKEDYKSYTNIYLKDEIKAGILFHPSYLFRQPKQKRLFWQDLLKLKDFLREKKIKF